MSTCCDSVELQILDTITSVDGSVAAEGGLDALAVGQSSLTKTFAHAKDRADYTFVEFEVENLVDLNPLDVRPIRTSRTREGFIVQFAPVPDTVNYAFRWRMGFYSCFVTRTSDEPVPPNPPVVVGSSSGFYDSSLTALRGGLSALDAVDTISTTTGSLITLVFGTPPSQQTFRLYVGTADGSVPWEQVNALNSNGAAPARVWIKVGGY